MSEQVVTEADRERAEALIADIHSGWCAGHPEWQKDHPGYPCHCRLAGKRDALAAALAAERAKAREPFLALAAEYERHAGLMQAEVDSGGPLDVVMRSQAFLDAAASIRRAAEETA